MDKFKLSSDVLVSFFEMNVLVKYLWLKIDVLIGYHCWVFVSKFLTSPKKAKLTEVPSGCDFVESVKVFCLVYLTTTATNLSLRQCHQGQTEKCYVETNFQTVPKRIHSIQNPNPKTYIQNNCFSLFNYWIFHYKWFGRFCQIWQIKLWASEFRRPGTRVFSVFVQSWQFCTKLTLIQNVPVKIRINSSGKRTQASCVAVNDYTDCA